MPHAHSLPAGRRRARHGLSAIMLLAVLTGVTLLAPPPAAATHTALQGTVTTAGSGAPLAGATVAVDTVHGDPRTHTTTDAAGAYAIGHLSPGSYIISVSAADHRSESRTVTLDDTLTLDFALQPLQEPEPEPEPEPSGACPDEAGQAPFSDRHLIPEAHRGNVDCAAHHDVVGGFADGSYGPALAVRRDQMASFVARTLAAAGIELPDPEPNRFRDVSLGSPHLDSIGVLAAAGIVQGGPAGLPDDMYGPDLQVRRDQMASFLVRAAAFAGYGDLGRDEQAFDDVGPANPHFAAVNGAAEAGLAHGVAARTYAPEQGVRRDQMATFVVRLLALVGG